MKRIIFVSLFILFVFILFISMNFSHDMVSSKRVASVILRDESFQYIKNFENCLKDNKKTEICSNLSKEESEKKKIFQFLSNKEMLAIDFKNNMAIIFYKSNNNWECYVPKDGYEITRCNKLEIKGF